MPFAWPFISKRATTRPNDDTEASIQSPSVVRNATEHPERLALESSDRGLLQGHYGQSGSPAVRDGNSTSAASSFAAGRVFGSHYSSNTHADRGADTQATDVKSAEPSLSPPLPDHEKAPENVPLPPSPQTLSIVAEDPYLKIWQTVLNLYAEEMKMRIRSLERRNHSQNLRLDFMQHAEETIRRLQAASAQPILELGSISDALAHLRKLFNSVKYAEAEVRYTDEEMVKKEHRLSQVTKPVFEDEQSSLAMLDVLRENGIDIRAADVASSPSAYTDDSVNGDFQALDPEAERVDEKIKQINVLEDLCNNIRSRRIATEQAFVNAELGGSALATLHEEAAKELKERETAVQKEVKIAQDELDDLRAATVPDVPFEGLSLLSTFSADH